MNNEEQFLTIDSSLIPEGGENREPLAEGAYNATCIGIVSGNGTKYQKTETEPKVRMIFAVKEDEEIHFLRTNWMKMSLHDGQPQPSTLWLMLSAWTNQKTAKALCEKMGKFDIKYFLGKPIQVGVKINDKYNNISGFFAPKKGQATIDVEEIPEFLISGDKRVPEVKYVIVDGAKIKPKKVKENTTPVVTKKDTASKAIRNVEESEDGDLESELPF